MAAASLGWVGSPRGDYAAATVLQGSLVLLCTGKAKVSLAGSVDVGAFPEGVAFSPDGRFVYSGNFASNTITVLHLEKGRLADIHADIKLPGPPASAPDRFAIGGFPYRSFTSICPQIWATMVVE